MNGNNSILKRLGKAEVKVNELEQKLARHEKFVDDIRNVINSTVIGCDELKFDEIFDILTNFEDDPNAQKD